MAQQHPRIGHLLDVLRHIDYQHPETVGTGILYFKPPGTEMVVPCPNGAKLLDKRQVW